MDRQAFLKRGGSRMNTSKRKLSALGLVAGLMVMPLTLKARAQTHPHSTDAWPRTTNPPWYPSLQAFEHYNSARSHVFSMARFDGSFHGRNAVELIRSGKGAY